MCVWLSQRRRARCRTSSDAPRAAQRCMAMRAVCLRSFVASRLVKRSSASLEGHDSRPTCMVPAESCSRLSLAGSRLFCRLLVSYLPLAIFLKLLLGALRDVLEGLARIRGPSCTLPHEGTPVPRSAPAARASLLPENVKTLRSPPQVVRRVPRAQRRRRQPPQQIIDRSPRRRRLPRLSTRRRIEVPVHRIK